MTAAAMRLTLLMASACAPAMGAMYSEALLEVDATSDSGVAGGPAEELMQELLKDFVDEGNYATKSINDPAPAATPTPRRTTTNTTTPHDHENDHENDHDNDKAATLTPKQVPTRSPTPAAKLKPTPHEHHHHRRHHHHDQDHDQAATRTSTPVSTPSPIPAAATVTPTLVPTPFPTPAATLTPEPAPATTAGKNLGTNCWEACHYQNGPCDFCGAGHACCRLGFTARVYKKLHGHELSPECVGRGGMAGHVCVQGPPEPASGEQNPVVPEFTPTVDDDDEENTTASATTTSATTTAVATTINATTENTTASATTTKATTTAVATTINATTENTTASATTTKIATMTTTAVSTPIPTSAATLSPKPVSTPTPTQATKVTSEDCQKLCVLGSVKMSCVDMLSLNMKLYPTKKPHTLLEAIQARCVGQCSCDDSDVELLTALV